MWRVVKLHGVCLHHDLGALGACGQSPPPSSAQLQIMNAAGVNAVRDEPQSARSGASRVRRSDGAARVGRGLRHVAHSESAERLQQVFRRVVRAGLARHGRRDRNHPSIIMWSIGNEIPEQQSLDGWKQARRLTRLVSRRRPDPPHHVSLQQLDDAIRNKLANEVDVPGFNYKPNFYQAHSPRASQWVIYGSETASCVERGTYQSALEKYREAPVTADQQLRHHRAALGLLPGC